MKKPIILVALIPINLILAFYCFSNLSRTHKDAWTLAGWMAGLSIVMGIAIFIGIKLKKPK
jgi:hypothetical protein